MGKRKSSQSNNLDKGGNYETAPQANRKQEVRKMQQQN